MIKTEKVETHFILRQLAGFEQKAKQVNGILKQSCIDENIPFISHHGINPRLHYSGRGIHLNDKGSSRLANNFRNFLSDLELG